MRRMSSATKIYLLSGRFVPFLIVTFSFIFFSSHAFSWEDNERNRGYFRTILTVSSAAGVLESRSCNKGDIAKQAYEFFVEIVILKGTVGRDMTLTRQDAYEMLSVGLEARDEYRMKAYIPVETCNDAEDVLERFIR